jgi:BASS family bile acid:Na+ symporter
MSGDFKVMPILMGVRAALAWLGREGTRAVAVSIFLGLAVPPLAAYVKPYLSETVFVLLLFSYLRTDPTAFRGYLRAPGLAIVATLWTMVAVPLLMGSLYLATGLRETAPALFTILILHIAISPITSAVAFAALMGLDVAFSLLVLILSNVAAPVTVVAMSYLFLGSSLISPLELGVKLALLFIATGTAAWAIRRIAGPNWIARQKEPIDGLNVIAMFVFAIAAMDGVVAQTLADPLFVLGLIGFLFVLSFVLIGLTVVVFLRAGIDFALAVSFLAGQRNVGLVMAVIGSVLPPVAWLYFALAQFPIYLFPALLRPLARRLAEKR